MNDLDWHGQNIPVVHHEWDGSSFSILPVLEFLLSYDEDTIEDLLPDEDSYGWGDSLANSFAWAANAYKVNEIIPDFSRYGCLPYWFPTTDGQGRQLTPQGQVDRFLYMLNIAYGGFLGDHRQANPVAVAEAILEVKEDFIYYLDCESGDGLEWEFLKE